MKAALGAIGILLFAWSVPLAAGDFDGKWEARFESLLGHEHYVFELRSDGSTLTGTAESAHGRYAIEQGRIVGKLFTFVEYVPVDGGFERTVYVGEVVDAKTLQLSRKVGDISLDWLTAYRVRTEASTR